MDDGTDVGFNQHILTVLPIRIYITTTNSLILTTYHYINHKNKACHFPIEVYRATLISVG